MFTVEERIITSSEIATLEEAKVYFRTEESGGVEDSLIQSLIESARSLVEKYIDRSLVDSTVTVFVSDWRGYLPFGPIVHNSVQIDGTATLQGNKYPYAIAGQNVTITYNTTAFDSEECKNAVLELAFYWYERGEFTGGVIPPKIKSVLAKNSRLNFIA